MLFEINKSYFNYIFHNLNKYGLSRLLNNRIQNSISMLVRLHNTIHIADDNVWYEKQLNEYSNFHHVNCSMEEVLVN